MSLDSVWALAFILGALYLVILRRPVLAGLSLGLSIGCRITSGAMLLPLAVLLLQRQSRREALVNIARLCVATGVIGAAAFAPVLVTYGWSFFTFSETMGYPPWHDVFLQATTEVWGSLGVLGLLVALLFLVFKPPTACSQPTRDQPGMLVFNSSHGPSPLSFTLSPFSDFPINRSTSFRCCHLCCCSSTASWNVACSSPYASC